MTDTAIIPAQAMPMAKPADVAESMRNLCAEMKEKRGAILAYVKDAFEEGVDFGHADPRSNKKTLLKPGAEKICQLFQLRPIWRKDTETWEMLGNPTGTVCYKCEIIDRNGVVHGEGRGAEKVGNKSRDANKAIKAAEKCALVDAALYTFCLSELFTQDLEREAERVAGKDEDTGDTPATEKDKLVLRRQVTQYMNGVPNPDNDKRLTPDRLILAAVTQVLSKPSIETMRELDAVRTDILAGKYNLVTGTIGD